MDYKEFYDRIDFNEKKLRETKSELKDLKIFANSLRFPSNTCDSDINKMFDEKYRITYALQLTKGHIRSAAKILGMSERNLFRLIAKYEII